MVVALIGGPAGVGKTTQIFTIANAFRPTRWASLETKDRRFFQAFLKETGSPPFLWDVLIKTYPEGHVNVFGDPDSFMVDPCATLAALEAWITATLRERPRTIVIDGISDLRNFAIAEWIEKDNRIKIANNAKPRETIGEENYAAWSDVNDRVRRLIMPLIQYAYDAPDVNLFFTTQMRDQYGIVDRKSKKVGEVPDVKPWVTHEAEVILVFKKDRDEASLTSDIYWMECQKIPAWAQNQESKFNVRLRKNDGLLEVFSLHGFV